MRRTVLCLFLLAISGIASAQVNTEAMRRLDLGPGWYNKLGLSMDYSAGNTDVLTLKTSFRSDYVWQKSHTFVVTNFKLGRKDGKSFTNKGFVHLRGMRLLSGLFMIEGFLQKQFNESIRLDDRELAGGGFRIVIMHPNKTSKYLSLLYLYLGIGAMWEYEELDIHEGMETELFRSTNYVTGRLNLNKRVVASATCYFQPALEQLSDYRILLEAGLRLGITGNLTFDNELSLRYDSDPPAGIEKSDLEVVHGVSYSF